MCFKRCVANWERWVLPFGLATALVWNVPDLRLPPPGEHAWRDATGIGVTRGFLTEGFDLFTPHVAERGGTSGVTGMELPLVNFAVALLCKLFGESYALEHGVVWLLLVPLAVGMQALGREVLEEPGAPALASALLCLSPLVLTFSHKLMPEIPMLTALTWGAAWALRALRAGRSSRALGLALAAGGCFLLCAVLKPTGAAVGIFLIPPALRARRREGGRAALPVALFALPPLVGAALWFHHAQALTAQSGLAVFKLSQDWWEWIHLVADPGFLGMLLGRWLHLYLLWPTVIWLVLSWREARDALRAHPDVALWLVAAFGLVLGFGRHNFDHSYYALPLLVPLALLLGAFVARAAARLRRPGVAKAAFLAIYAATGIVRALPRFPPPGFDPAEVEAAAAQLTPGRTIATDARTPVVSLVLVHGVGWALPADTLTPERLRELEAQGAVNLVESAFGGWLSPASRASLGPPIFATANVRVYRLAPE